MDHKPISPPRKKTASPSSCAPGTGRPALGAVVALAVFVLTVVALALVCAAPAPRAAGKEDNTLLARVNGREIRLSDVYKEIESLPLGDQIDVRDRIERFTDSLITEEVLFQSVLAAGFAGDEALRAKIKAQVVEHLISTRVREKIAVSDEDIRRYYSEHRDVVRGLHVRVRQILRKTRPECEAIRARIRQPGDFAREAEAHSLDPGSAANGGEVGLLMPVLGPNALGFELELFAMSVGEMRIFDSREGCHLVQVTEVIDPPDPPFEQVRAYVRPILEREQEQKLLQALIGQASRAVRVERSPLPQAK
jgi:peptidyl-prolyl cis-trans isomerase C